MDKVEYEIASFNEGLYLSDAREALGSLFDIGVNVCQINGDLLASSFVESGLAKQFERSNPAYVAGMSGVELLNILLSYMAIEALDESQARFERTPDYWLGWILAWYQNCSLRRYDRIFAAFSYERLVEMYHPLHEAPESKFYEVMERHFKKPDDETNLKKQRMAAMMSQSQLAKASGVGLRSIQMYEQRNKNIDNASAMTLYRLSLALHCSIEDLLEFI